LRQCLGRLFSEDEVRLAHDSLTDDKASSPDGYPMKFFKVFQDVVGSEVMQTVDAIHKKVAL